MAELAAFLKSLPDFPFVPCPICENVEGCGHSAPERARAYFEELRSSRDALVEALKPFAALGELILGSSANPLPDDEKITPEFTIGEYRRAASALRKAGESP